MSTETSESIEKNIDFNSTAFSGDSTIQQSPWQYYKRNGFRNYSNSAEESLNLALAFSIFQKHMDNEWSDLYEICLNMIEHSYESASSKLSTSRDESEEFIKEMLNGEAIDEHDERELLLPDSRRQGITMNWKKARELYNKLKING